MKKYMLTKGQMKKQYADFCNAIEKFVPRFKKEIEEKKMIYIPARDLAKEMGPEFLNKITRDIIEAENLTRYIDKNTISLPNRSLAKYYRLLGQYKDSIKFLEKKCKCSPEK